MKKFWRNRLLISAVVFLASFAGYTIVAKLLGFAAIVYLPIFMTSLVGSGFYAVYASIKFLSAPKEITQEHQRAHGRSAIRFAILATLLGILAFVVWAWPILRLYIAAWQE